MNGTGGKVWAIGFQCISLLRSCAGTFRVQWTLSILVLQMILLAGCSSVTTQPNTKQSGTIRPWSTQPGTILVSVKGWVKKPGDYSLPAHANIGEALEVAGGFWGIGHPSTLRVRRFADGHLQWFSVPLHDVNGKPQADFELDAWDVIYADETLQWSTNALNAKLIPEKKAKPAVLSMNAVITNAHNKDDISEILKLVGRFPRVGHEVESVNFLTFPAEAKVNNAVLGFRKAGFYSWEIAYLIRTDTNPNQVYVDSDRADDSSVGA